MKKELLTNKIDIIQRRLILKTDSLKSLDKPDTVQIRRNIALQQELDSIRQKIPFLALSESPGGKTDSVQNAIRINFDQLSDRVNEISAGKIRAPNVDKINFENKSLSLPNVPDVVLPAGSRAPGSADLPNVTVPETGLNGSNADLPDVNRQLKGPKLNEVPELPGTEKVSESIKDVGSITREAGSLIGEASSLKNEIGTLKDKGIVDHTKVTKQLEDEIGNVGQVKSLEKKLEDVNPAANWNDPEVAKEMMFNKSKEQAMNHFQGHEKELTAALDQFAKIRSEIKKPEGTVDMLHPGANPMKEKKFFERLVPGLTLQIQKPGPFWIDFNPSLGYKVSGKFVVHAGWNYRWAFQKGEVFLIGQRIYGPRASVDFTWKEFFAFTAQSEIMNAPVKIPGKLSSAETTGRQWVWSHLVGTKVSYNVSKSVRGNAQMFYNIYDPKHQSPYGDRLVVRMGFEFILKKREQSPQVK